jgi:nicotinamidase-related amidase
VARADKTTIGDNRRRGPYALIILDLISDFSFPDGERLVNPALRAARNIARLKERVRQQSIPCIYVNDNHGHWNSDRNEFISQCMAGAGPAARIAELLTPDPDDFFVMKPRHSGFFATPLHTLLNQLQVHALILTGVTTHQCVLYTAVDAYMRDFSLIIPRDCVASIKKTETTRALSLFASSMNAVVTEQQRLRFTKTPIRKRKTAAP